MKAYRIGRVQLPWTNLEPPIRAGPSAHRKTPELVVDEEDSASSADVDDADSVFSAKPDPLSSSNSSVGISDSELDPVKDAYRDEAGVRRRNVTSAPTSAGAKTTEPFPTENLSRATYTAAMEQKEIADGIRNYPSLDAETQQAIRSEYEALHKLIQEQGLYDCPYGEYGKEMIRYSVLFAAFFYFLRIEWYLTSAVFLGLFWVCVRLPDSRRHQLTCSAATDHVHRARCWPPWHHRQLCH